MFRTAANELLRVAPVGRTDWLRYTSRRLFLAFPSTIAYRDAATRPSVGRKLFSADIVSRSVSGRELFNAYSARDRYSKKSATTRDQVNRFYLEDSKVDLTTHVYV